MSACQRIFALIFAVSPVVYFPTAEWLATSPAGSELLLHAEMFFALPLLAGYLLIPGLTLGLCFARYRRRAAVLLFVSLLYIACCFAGIRLGYQTRMAGMKAFTIRAGALLAAIQQYERDHLAPPESLQKLVPRYLPKIPFTGMGAYPEFQYSTGAECRKWYHENPWALSVLTSRGILNWDSILYFPRQNYPEKGYSGVLERVGDWAYVHE